MSNELDRDIKHLKKTIETHIGDGGTGIHELVNDKSAGFMAPEEHTNLKSIFKGRTSANGKDIDQLTPGFYYGFNFVHSPAGIESDTFCEIDVTKSIEGFIQNTFKRNYDNKTWERTQHKGAWGTWGIIRQERLLWKGFVSDTDTPLIFQEPYTSFERLKFVIVGLSSTTESYEIQINGDNIAVPWSNIPNPTNGQAYVPQFQHGEIIVRLNKNGNTCYIQYNTSISIITGSVTKINEVGKISEIWGIK
ncbi:hypothetical protein LABALGNA3A7_05130 [Dellaglioa algida]|nr:hypothetical protein LABALGNA3A7_05130 [Dellaglioa algida]